jgi:rod shape-determining protein MreB
MPMLLESVCSLFSNDLAIDLGTANTWVYAKGWGIVLNEPSMVAVRRGDRGANRVLAVGEEAKTMLEGAPGDIVATGPMKDGGIADFDITEAMLRYFIRKVDDRRSLVGPRIIISVPSGVTQIGKTAVRVSAESAGAREVFLIKEPMAAAIGAGLPITEPACNVVVDIGAGTTEVAIISLAGTVYSRSIQVAGDRMDEAIVQHLKRRYNLLIGLQAAELIKIAVGSAYPTGEPESIEVKGRDLVTGIPRVFTIDSEEIAEAIHNQVNAIVETVRIALEQMPPELSADVVDKGIVLTGGGALLRNLDVLLREEIRLPITITDDPLTTVALGIGKVLDNPSILKEISVN